MFESRVQIHIYKQFTHNLGLYELDVKAVINLEKYSIPNFRRMFVKKLVF